MLSSCPICGEYGEKIRRKNYVYEYPIHKCNPNVLAGINGTQERDGDINPTQKAYDKVFSMDLYVAFGLVGLAGDI